MLSAARNIPGLFRRGLNFPMQMFVTPNMDKNRALRAVIWGLFVIIGLDLAASGPALRAQLDQRDTQLQESRSESIDAGVAAGLTEPTAPALPDGSPAEAGATTATGDPPPAPDQSAPSGTDGASTSTRTDPIPPVAPPPTGPTGATGPSGSAATDPAGRIVRHGTGLYLNGRPYSFVGVAAPNATTLGSVNYGCGAPLSDAELDQLFTSLPPRTVVNMWATSQLGWNRFARSVDFTAIDRAVAVAARHGAYLNLSLATQQGYCGDGHWKNEAWYGGGYRRAAADDETRLSYLDWVRQIVPHYAGTDTVAMWTLMVEPDASSCAVGFDGAACYGRLRCSTTAAATLRSFYDTVGGEVKRLDPGHLVVSGTRGATDCGVQGGQYADLHRSPGIDLCDLHPYGEADNLLPISNRDDIQMCSSAGKATIVGEMGIEGGDGQAGCPGFTDRSAIFARKFSAYRAAGASGFFLWAWAPKLTGCTMAIFPGDPVLAAARAFMS